MIDLHAHILPGIDDGPATMAEALDVLRTAALDGVNVIAATPHVRDDYPTTPETMERAVAAVRRAVDQEGILIQVVTGGEIALDQLPGLTDEELRRFTLGKNGRYVLVEAPYVGWPLDIGERLFDVQLRGFTPVIGHAERNDEIQSRPERLRPLVEHGILVQVTAASLDGRLGRPSGDAARTLVATGLAHLVASDAHAPDLRRAGLSDARSALRNDRLGRWLVHQVPLAIIKGRDPPRPPGAASGRRRLTLARRVAALVDEDRQRA
jgi:protein-tyrosine phosphatase